MLNWLNINTNFVVDAYTQLQIVNILVEVILEKTLANNELN